MLECAAGKSNRIVARELRVDEDTVGKWQQRVLAKRSETTGASLGRLEAER